ncbi:hypothetical protein HGRIS_003112 [Hohenbuehelia grisea]|uniref:Tetraspanin Tsp2 n=1 Tax=Hohenbuehelia grisea TaxID=104357 RepID=A0ABR3JPL8_9AGAR
MQTYHKLTSSLSPSRRDSIASHANSTFSNAASTRHMLADMNTPLDPPTAPFAAGGSSSSTISREGSPFRPGSENGADSNVSLSVNYLPSKFSNALLTGGARKRKGGKGIDPSLPKMGGGVEAFRHGEARMPGENDEDYDGVTSGWFGGKEGGRTKPKMRWNKFKWLLFCANLLLFAYALVALVFCLLTWFNVWTHADVVRVGNRPELIVSTIAASVGIVASVIGWAGILLNNRSFLAVYNVFLWVTFAFLVVPGYISYRKRTFNLEGKINAQWSRDLGSSGRLRIQNQLSCCGYFSPFVEATVSATCYARSVLPGCKRRYLDFERMVLGRWFTVAFAIVPFHLGVMVIALLCSNHVTYRFGKGMMPKAYRLSMNSMAVIMDNYANQLAEQYGTDVASEILSRSRSNLPLDTAGTAPYTTGQNTHHKYESLSHRNPSEISA